MTGKIKVAILDTGIDRNHEYLKNSIIGGVSFESDNNYITISEHYDDDNGHGTACASIVKNEYNDVGLLVIKVMDKNGRTNIQVLEEALKNLIDTDVSIINLSLSIVKSEKVKDLYDICSELKKRKKIIVASLANGYEESYPAVFDNVLGVRGFILENKNDIWFCSNKKIQCIVDDNLYIRCDIHNSYKLFGKCNSQAAASLSGKIAKSLSKEPDLDFETLCCKLEKMAVKTNWTDSDLIASKRYPSCKENLYNNNNRLFIEVSKVVQKYLKLKEYDCKLSQFRLFNKKDGFMYEDCFGLLKELEKCFQLKFNYMEISRYDFISLNTLTELVEKYII